MAMTNGKVHSNASCPHATIGCQELLKMNDYSHCGEVLKPLKRYKRNWVLSTVVEKLPWIHCYIVLCQGSLYRYSNCLAKKPSSAFSLYGYHQVIRARDVKKYDWAFKIVNLVNPNHCKYFAVGSEREMKIWLRKIKMELFNANANLLPMSSVNVPVVMDDKDLEKSIFGDQADGVVSHHSQISIQSGSTEDDTESDDSSDYDKIDEEEMSRPVRKPAPLPPTPDDQDCSVSSADSEQDWPSMSNTPQASSKISRVPTPPNKEEKPPFHIRPVPNPRSNAKPAPPPVKQKPLVAVKPVQPMDEINSSVNQASSRLPPVSPHNQSKWRMTDVLWEGTDRITADRIIRGIGVDGVFMLRPSEKCEKTLVCFVDGATVKFMINRNLDNEYYIQKDLSFPTVLALLEHYHCNNLPLKNTCLTEPYTKYTAR